MTGAAVARWWVLTRLALLVVFVLFEFHVRGSAHYYAWNLEHLPRRGFRHTLVEYPLPMLGFLAVPWLVAKALGLRHAYVTLFALGAMATDAAYTTALARIRPNRSAVMVWLLGVPLLGALVYFRYDLAPAVLVGVALLLLRTRPAASLVSAAVATALKLWPVVTVPPLLAGARNRGRALLAGLATGAVLAGLTVVLGGWARLLSPFRYELHRGLQVESVWASPAMLGYWLTPGIWRTRPTHFKDLEVVGPGVHTLLVAGQVATVAVLLALVALWWMMLRSRARPNAQAVVWSVLAGICGLIVTDRVLSPQYLIWPLAAAVAGLAVTRGDRALVAWSAVLLVVLGLTQADFPLTAKGLAHHDQFTHVVVPILVTRNTLLVGLFLVAFGLAWRMSAVRSGAREPAMTVLEG